MKKAAHNKRGSLPPRLVFLVFRRRGRFAAVFFRLPRPFIGVFFFIPILYIIGRAGEP
jgi:hypothetical protein